MFADGGMEDVKESGRLLSVTDVEIAGVYNGSDPTDAMARGFNFRTELLLSE